MAVLKYFRVHISQLSPFGAARVSHFEVLTRVLNLSPSVTVFRAFYTRSYSDGLFSFAKRSTSAPSCFPKPPDSIKNWADHFFWVDSCVFPISVPLYTGGVLEKDSAPHLTARQEQTVKLLESHKAPFRRYPECFLCLVGLSPYYPFDENSYLAFEYPDGSGPSGGGSEGRRLEVSAPTEEGQEDVAPEEAYLELADPDEGTTVARQSEEEVVTEQPKKVKKKRLLKQSDVLPAKKLRVDHPTLVSGTGGKTLAGLEQIRLAGSRLPDREQLAFHPVAPSSQGSEGFLDSSAQTNLRIRNTVESSSTLGIPVDTTAAATTFTKAAVTTSFATGVNPDLAGPSQPEESEGSDDSFYEPPTLDPSEAKRWSRAEHELELKEKLRAKHAARGRLMEEKDLEILRLKSQLAEKEAEVAEVICLRDQVSSLFGEKYALTAEVSVLKVTVTQKDHDISLLDSRAACLASTLDDVKMACAEAGDKITSLASERDKLASEDFKEKMEIQQEEQAQELFNRVAELEAHIIDVSGQYQGILGHALGRAVDFGMQEGLEAGYKHGVAGRDLSVVDAYNPESKKDAGIDEVLDCFLLDGPLAGLLKAAYLQPCIKQLSIPIHHAGDNTAVEETSMSFALMNVHARAEGAKKHVAALRQLMMEIVSAPLSSQTWVGEASTSAAPLSIEDYDEEDTDEALGSVVAVPKLETCHF
ncbi:hypothetical protein Tco_1166814 [Tanacetum coccineum]